MDPLRALFLEVGVDDRQAVMGLRNVTLAADQAERALLGVATASKAAGANGLAVNANVRLAQSYNALTVAARSAASAVAQSSIYSKLYAAATTPPPTGFSAQTESGTFPAGFNVLARQSMEQRMASRTPWSARAFMGGINAPAGGPYMPSVAGTLGRPGGRGNFGLGTSIFIATAGLGAAGYGFGQAAGLQRSSLLASYASGQSPAAMGAQSLGLSSQYGLRLSAAGSLTQEVAQLGAMTPQGQREIARAGAGFNVLESGVAPNEAAAAIYRLLKATNRSTGDFDRATASATRYAGAIFAAGNQSAAGAKEVFSMVQEIEPLAQLMHLGADGTIALSAAFADLNANQRELFRGALTRMTIQGKLNPDNPIGSLLAIAERLRNATSDSQRLNILKALGFTNIRDVQTVSVMAASMDTFARSLSAVKEELTGTSSFDTKVGQVLATMSGQWDTLKASMDGAAASMVGSVAPALGIVLSTLTGIADTVSGNPILAALFGIGAAGLAGMAIRGAYRRYLGGNMAGRVAELGFDSPRGAMRWGRLTNNLMGVLPFMGRGTAEHFATTRFGVSLAEAAGLGASHGLGRTSSLSLGLLKMLPFGEGLAVSAAERMAAGGLAGGALKLATGPVGWIIAALTMGAPLFERIGGAMAKMGSQGGALGVVFNTVSLIFDVLAAGGRILNQVFGWIGGAGKWLLNVATFGHADDILGGVNTGLQAAQSAVNGIAATSKASSAPKTPISVSIYTGGSQSGYQTAIDEVARRAARSMPATSYGGLTV